MAPHESPPPAGRGRSGAKRRPPPHSQILGALLVVLLTTVSAAAQAQAPAETPSLAELERRLAAGRAEEVLTALESRNDRPDVVRLRLRAAVATGRAELALRSYTQLRNATQKDDAVLLGGVGTATLGTLVTDKDLVLAIDACRALLRRAANPCGATRLAEAKDKSQPIAVRLAAVRALSEAASPPASVPELTRTIVASAGPDERALAQGLVGLPPQVAVPIWTRLADTGPREVQYLSIGALGRAGTPEARRALDAIRKRGAPPGLSFAVTVASAGAGDPVSLQELKKAIPLLQGSDVLAAAEILQAHGEAAVATPLLRQAAAGDNEIVRIEAAAKLGPADADLARKVLNSARVSENPILRAAALAAFRTSPLLDIPALLDGLADPNPWVRLRAGEAAAALSASSAPAEGGRARR
jgi:hypothetical protein